MRDWIARERPDAVCLQEIKAKPEQIPEMLFESEGYWCYWHGGGGYSGVALHVRCELCAERPAFAHPAFDHETRIVTARRRRRHASRRSTCPTAERTTRPSSASSRRSGAGRGERREARPRLLICGDLNVARTDSDVHPKERKPGAIGQREDERALIETASRHGLVDVGRAARSGERRPLHVVGALAQPAPAQHRLAHRLPAGERGAGGAGDGCVVRADVGTSDHAPGGRGVRVKPATFRRPAPPRSGRPRARPRPGIPCPGG